MASQKFNLNSEYRIEPIILSLTNENYNSIIEQLSSELEEFDKDLKNKLDRYLWIANKQLNGKTLNHETLKQEFPSFILSDYKPLHPDELIDYIQIFITQKKQRAISGKMSLLADNIRTQGLTPEIVEEIYKYTAMQPTTEDFVPIQKKFKELYDKQVQIKGISLLCPELDKRIGGILPGTICSIVGGPGSMKTTYTTNIMYNQLKEGKNILYLSLEEPAMQLYSKLLSRVSTDVGKQIQHNDITHSNLEDTDKEILYNEIEPFIDKLPGKLYIVDEEELTDYNLTTLEATFKKVEKLSVQETNKGIDILVVDHAQLLKYARTDMAESSVVNMYVSFFRQQSLSWLHEKKQITVFLLSQVNREGMDYAQKHNGMYLMQHIANASEIERASTYMISVYNDSQLQMMKILKVGTMKLRNAQLLSDTVQVYADGAYYQVGDTAVPEQEDYSTDDLFGDTQPAQLQQTEYSLDDMMAMGGF